MQNFSFLTPDCTLYSSVLEAKVGAWLKFAHQKGHLSLLILNGTNVNKSGKLGLTLHTKKDHLSVLNGSFDHNKPSQYKPQNEGQT